MGASPPADRYERRLYAAFQAFDEEGAEALPRGAVLALCDALQLEERGAALADRLFGAPPAAAGGEGAPGAEPRVTFAQFRGGLLSVLGAEQGQPAPDATHSDDDSSGREVAPKLVVGAKRYGRRSRPPRAASAPAASRKHPPPPPPEEPPSPPLAPGARLDCARALALCRRLRMDGLDRGMVERIFEAAPAAHTTVGEFFDRLNCSLTSSIAAAADAPGGRGGDALPAELVADAWEGAGVPRPRGLLAELGFGGEDGLVGGAELERALDVELGAAAGAGEARALLLPAALALARLRLQRAEAEARDARAERDRLRASAGDSERRLRALAHDVDESQARLEAELAASLRRAEARHAEAARAAEAERRAERERLGGRCAALEGEVSRRAEAEARLRAEGGVLRRRAEEAEARAAAGEERAAAAERERARLAGEAGRAAAAASAAPEAEARAAALEARVEQLARSEQGLRDRCDELCAALEAAGRRAPGGDGAEAKPAASWREETGAAGHDAEAQTPDRAMEARVECVGCAAAGREAARRAEHAGALECSLEAMRLEYERCEEYWSAKLAEERSVQAAEQRAGDQRLAELAARVRLYEQQFAPDTATTHSRLPPIEERASLEAQVSALEDEFAAFRASAAAQLSEREAALRRARARRASCAQCVALAGAAREARAGAAREAGALRTRLARAEACVGRLTARLAAADMLVKELYVETCLQPATHRRM